MEYFIYKNTSSFDSEFSKGYRIAQVFHKVGRRDSQKPIRFSSPPSSNISREKSFKDDNEFISERRFNKTYFYYFHQV